MSVAPVDGVILLTIACSHRSYKRQPGGHRKAGVNTVLHVKSHMWFARVVAHKAYRIHMAVAIIVVIPLRIAEVETASSIDMDSRGHHIHPLRLPIHGNTRGRVVAVTHPG